MTDTTTLPAATSGAATHWWRDAVGYQVYIRSFADADGDGVGDMRGLLGRLEHLSWLGVQIIWITPFYPSPMHDHGYDVADYCDVEPTFGVLADLDAVVAEAHRLGMKVIIDLVPNHSSSDHPWFVDSRSSRDSAHRDWYVWRDGAPDGGPPNNWASHFGGPAWTYDEGTGQWYLHLFLPEQPDLNWESPAVADAFDEILEFWLSRGVDGFRIDVAHALVKNQAFPDLPLSRDTEHVEGPGGVSDFSRLEHLYDVDQSGNAAIYQRWRRIADRHDALLIGEVYLLEPERLLRYVADDALHLAFWFKPLHLDWDPAALRAALVEVAQDGRGRMGWVSGSHDRTRAVTRFGGGTVGRERALALSTLLLGLPGTPFIYQGEELGLEDVHVAPEDVADPIALRHGDLANGRDGCRTPMPWEPGTGLGFSSAEHAWLPYGPRTDADTVAVQRQDAGSTLQRYRALIALRRERTDLIDGDLEWLDAGTDVIAYRRGRTVVAANASDAPVEVDLGARRILVSTVPGRDDRTVAGAVAVAPREAVIAALD